MPAATTEEQQSGLSSLKHLQNSLDDLGEASLVQAQDTLEDCPEEPDEQRAGKKVADVVDVISELAGRDHSATELDRILSDPNLRALIQAYDDVVERNFEDVEIQEGQNTLMSPPPPVFSAVTDQIRLVGIRKSKTEPLGITVKIDEIGDLVIARIMSGSMIDKQGLLHVGDIIKEVNGMPVSTPEQLMDIIRNTEGNITLKIIPTYQEQQASSQVYMKAHFNYDPQKTDSFHVKKPDWHSEMATFYRFLVRMTPTFGRPGKWMTRVHLLVLSHPNHWRRREKHLFVLITIIQKAVYCVDFRGVKRKRSNTEQRITKSLIHVK
ncbi:hypothetical protein ScPMuIL_017008 [Solemya velum]